MYLEILCPGSPSNREIAFIEWKMLPQMIAGWYLGVGCGGGEQSSGLDGGEASDDDCTLGSVGNCFDLRSKYMALDKVILEIQT